VIQPKQCDLPLRECEARFSTLEKEMLTLDDLKDDVHEIKKTATTIKNWGIGGIAVLVIQYAGFFEFVKMVVFK